MSATADPSTEADDSVSKEERLKQYLLSKAQDGELYFKSKFIADEVGLSPKEIGALMVKLRDSATELSVEKWSYTSATTWRIEPA
jgi:CRP-like cAMP-binding protein